MADVKSSKVSLQPRNDVREGSTETESVEVTFVGSWLAGKYVEAGREYLAGKPVRVDAKTALNLLAAHDAQGRALFRRG